MVEERKFAAARRAGLISLLVVDIIAGVCSGGAITNTRCGELCGPYLSSSGDQSNGAHTPTPHHYYFYHPDFSDRHFFRTEDLAAMDTTKEG